MRNRNIRTETPLVPNTDQERADAARFICRQATSADDAHTIASALGLDADHIRQQAEQRLADQLRPALKETP